MKSSHAVGLAAAVVALGLVATACAASSTPPAAAPRPGTPTRSTSVRSFPTPTASIPARSGKGIYPPTLPLGNPATPIPYLLRDVLVTATGRARLRLPDGVLYPHMVGTDDGSIIINADPAKAPDDTQFYRVGTDGTMTPIGKPYLSYNGGPFGAPVAGRIYMLGCPSSRIGRCTLTQVDARTGAPLHVLKTFADVLYADSDGALITAANGVQRWHLDGRVTPFVTLTEKYAQPVYVNPILGILVRIEYRAIEPGVSLSEAYEAVSRLNDPNRIVWQFDGNSLTEPRPPQMAPDGRSIIVIGRDRALRVVAASNGEVEHTIAIAPGFVSTPIAFEDADHLLTVMATDPANGPTTEWLVRCSTTGTCVRLTGPITNKEVPGTAFSFPSPL